MRTPARFTPSPIRLPLGRGVLLALLVAGAVLIPGRDQPTAAGAFGAPSERGATRATRPLLNVRQPPYNAKGSDDPAAAAADTAAFRRALADAAGSSGTVYIPRGTYWIDQPLSLPLAAANVTVVGDGPASFLRFALPRDCGDTGTANTGLSGEQVYRVTIANVRLGGDACRMLAFNRSTFLTVRRTVVSGADTAGIVLDNVSDAWVVGNQLSDNGRGHGVSAGHPSLFADIRVNLGGSGGERLTIRGNRCLSDRVNYGIALYDVAWSKVLDNAVAGTTATTATKDGYGIVLYSKAPGRVHHNVVRGNSVRRTGGTGIYLQSAHQSVVADNEVDEVATAQGDATLLVGGIASAGGEDVTIVGNRVRRSGKAGITFSGARTAVRDNTVEDVPGAGIILRGKSDDSTIERNRIDDAAAGIRTWDDPQPTPVSGLTIVDNTVATITDRTTGQVVPYGIALQGVFDSTVAHNTLINAGTVLVRPTTGNNVVTANHVQ